MPFHKSRFFPPMAFWLPWLFGFCFVVGAFSSDLQAAKGDSRAGLFLGTTTQTVKGLRTFGTIFGGSFGFEFSEDFLWTIGGSFSSTDGEAFITDAQGQVTERPLSSTSTSLQTGLLAYFNRRPENFLIFFLGGGIDFLNYDFDYTGTDIGRTSGTTPGIFTDLGMELRFTSSVTLIFSFGFQFHKIKTENSGPANLVSGGLVFSLRIST